MRAPTSKLARYCLDILGDKYNKGFSYAFMKEDGEKKDYFYKKHNDCSQVIDYTRDGTGKKIEKDHPLYELSEIIKKFEEGRNTKIKEKDSKKLKEYFEKKGEHFCAGYLANFNTIVRRLDNRTPVFNMIEDFFLKLKHKAAYSVALQVYMSKKYPNLGNSLNLEKRIQKTN